jgi:hypothetical protein
VRSQGRANRRCGELPDDREEHEHHDGDEVLPGLAADDGARDAGTEKCPCHRTAEEADEAQGADDEALTVTRDSEGGGDHQQREIQQVSVHEPYGIGRS